ncbi:MAG: hypothetical protein L6R40_005044 [Gallowayella cf. fulva]|nr:MAG: hypothetical protein L6R40_005044 [Xanthomendoza cf. fulva]
MRVLISGAGVAGPTLAWFLAKTGARITIFEKAHTLLPHGQNVDIMGSALTVMKKMGLLDQVRRFNTTEKGTQFIDSRGKPFAPFPVQKGFVGSFTSEFEILRGDLSAILYDATRHHPNIIYRFSTTVKEVISNDDHSVKVESSDGEVEEFDLLVAADGQWSKVRKQCFPTESVRIVDLDMTAIYWTIPRLPHDNDWWNVYLALQARVITLRPDPYGTIRAMFTRMPCNEAQKKEWMEAARGGKVVQQALLRKEFADAGWQAERLLDSMDQSPDFYFHVIQQIKMSKWSTGRVVCLGDAAFAPSPLTGSGTSMAITSAYLLAGELTKLDHGDSPTKALDAYESTFRPFVEKSQEVPSWVPDIAHPENAWKRSVFSICIRGLSQLAKISWLMRRLPHHHGEEDFPLPQYASFEESASDVSSDISEECDEKCRDEKGST